MRIPAPDPSQHKPYADVVATVNGTKVHLSGRTQAAMPGSQNLSVSPVGDIDGDGRDETLINVAGPFPPANANAQIYEWVDAAAPIAARAKSRGGSGTTGTGRKPRIKTRGHCGLGRTTFFDVRGVMPSGITFLVFGDPADADLAPLGAPGNRAYVNSAATLSIVTDARGIARYQLAVANVATLLGARLRAQGAVFDPAANALGVVTSNAIDLEVH